MVSMSRSWPPYLFPDLNQENCTETSPESRRYNCIAWAANNDGRWWWPDAFNVGYWPSNAPREETLEAFVRAFESLGYFQCADGSLEPGFEKIALYAKGAGEKLIPTHAARQLPNGRWTSKLGNCEDIEHSTVEALLGPSYGSPVCYLKRLKEHKTIENSQLEPLG
jgi:hypothetical protein